MAKLPLGSRALLHLYDMRWNNGADTVTEEVTQLGISDALGIPRSHVTRVLKPLIDSGKIDENKRHVKGKNRKLKVYSITPGGIEEVRELLGSFSEKEVMVRDRGRSFTSTVGDILDLPNVHSLELVDRTVEGSTYELGRERVIVCTPGLESCQIFDREDAVDEARSFLESDPSTMVILANRGYGSSSLMSEIALNETDRPLLWHDLSIEGDRDSIMRSIMDLGDRIQCGGLSGIRDTDSLLCFDNYHILPDDGVDTMIEILESLDGGRAKMMVAMRRENPSYNRFYQRADVERGRVVEIGVGRLELESMGLIFGSDIDPEALKLIYMMTGGQPLSLELLRGGRENALRQMYPNEEVRFMMYLRTKRIESEK